MHQRGRDEFSEFPVITRAVSRNLLATVGDTRATIRRTRKYEKIRVYEFNIYNSFRNFFRTFNGVTMNVDDNIAPFNNVKPLLRINASSFVIFFLLCSCKRILAYLLHFTPARNNLGLRFRYRFVNATCFSIRVRILHSLAGLRMVYENGSRAAAKIARIFFSRKNYVARTKLKILNDV